jgi:hypothetical protein
LTSAIVCTYGISRSDGLFDGTVGGIDGVSLSVAEANKSEESEASVEGLRTTEVVFDANIIGDRD